MCARGDKPPTMPPRKSNTLTEAELRLMKMLWARVSRP